MLTKFLNFLLSIFYKKEEEIELSVKPWVNRKKLDTKIIKKLHSESNDSTTIITTNRINKRYANKNKVISQIKNNLYFLNTLLLEINSFNEYSSYIIKLEDIKKQSQGCLKVLFRIKEEAPYFSHTLKTIYSHTKMVSQLFDI